jgi:acyl-CoA synthetase (AMP-forming)/AMP-acid ligase II
VRNLIETMPFRISRAFGMTEFGHVCSTDAGTTREQCMWSVGTPQPEMTVEIQDEAGRNVSPGREGRIMVRGPFLFAGYLTPETVDQDVVGRDGFFDTGDLGIMDEQGCLQITGRVKNVIRRGAETVPVSLLEDVIASNRAVIHAVVVGIPDSRLGELPVACVQLKSGCSLSLAEIEAMFEARNITKKFWPTDLRIFKQWPVGVTGKIDRRMIAEQIRGSAQS